ncbi:hypothetical protein BVY01_04250, partial [bacterium I07]
NIVDDVVFAEDEAVFVPHARRSLSVGQLHAGIELLRNHSVAAAVATGRCPSILTNILGHEHHALRHARPQLEMTLAFGRKL